MSQKPDTHKSWRLTVPGYPPFTMGGEECTEDEARYSAALIWPKSEFTIEPASSRHRAGIEPAITGQPA